jgi:hypothetical protein
MDRTQIISKLLTAIRFMPHEVDQLVSELGHSPADYQLSESDKRDGVAFLDLVEAIEIVQRSKSGATGTTQRTPSPAIADDDDDDEFDSLDLDEREPWVPALITR